MVELDEVLNLDSKFYQTHVLIHFDEYDASIEDFVKCDITCASISKKVDLNDLTIDSSKLLNKFNCLIKGD